MNTKSLKLGLWAGVAAIALTLGARTASAATNLNFYPFNSVDEMGNTNFVTYGWWWVPNGSSWAVTWTPYPTNEYDSTQDAAGNPSSGSIKQHYIWSGSGFQQAFNMTSLSNFFDGTKFAYGALDFRVDPSSTMQTNANGTSGIGQQLIISVTVQTNPDLTTSDNWDDVYRANTVVTPGVWQTIQGPFAARATNVIAFFTGLQGTGWTNDPALGYGQVILNVDNLRMTTPAIPPPHVSISKAIGGVEFVPLPNAAAGDASIFIMNIGWAQVTNTLLINWYSPGFLDSVTANPTPVTYSMTIPEFPGGANSNSEAFLELTPYTNPIGDGVEGWRTHPGDDMASAIFLDITNNNDSSASAVVYYKVNEPTTNVYQGSVIASLHAPSVSGTWSLTCNNNSLTLTGPGNTSTSFSIPPGDVVYFNDGVTPLGVWLGAKPGNTNNWGKTTVINDFKITYQDSALGTVVVTNYQFDPDNFNDWVVAADCTGVNPAPTNTAYRIQWDGPAPAASLLQASSVTGPWTASGFAIDTSNTNRISFVPSTAVLSPRGFYRVAGPYFTP